MNKNVKKNVILAVAAMSVATLSMGIMANKGVLSANAEGSSSFAVTGASVRLSDATQDNGIKFHVGLDKATYEEVSTQTGFISGTLILPEAMLGDNALDITNTAALNIETTGAWSVGTTNCESIAYVYDIPKEYHATDLIARGYYKYDGLGAPVYTKTCAPVSMAWVAKQEYDNANSKLTVEEKENLKTTYMTYTLTTHDEANNVVEEKPIIYGDKLNVAAAEKEGEYFVGWYNQARETAWDMQNGTVKGNVNLYPKYYTDSSKYTQVAGTTNKFYLSDFNDPDSISMFDTLGNGTVAYAENAATLNDATANGIKIGGSDYKTSGAKFNLVEPLDLDSFGVLIFVYRLEKEMSPAINYSIKMTSGEKSVVINPSTQIGGAGVSGANNKPIASGDAFYHANSISFYFEMSKHKSYIQDAIGGKIDGFEFAVSQKSFILDEIILENFTKPADPVESWDDPSRGVEKAGETGKYYISSFDHADSINVITALGGATFSTFNHQKGQDDVVDGKQMDENGYTVDGIYVNASNLNGIKYHIPEGFELNEVQTLLFTIRYKSAKQDAGKKFKITITAGDKEMMFVHNTNGYIGPNPGNGNNGESSLTNNVYGAFEPNSLITDGSATVASGKYGMGMYISIVNYITKISEALGTTKIDGIKIEAETDFILDEIMFEKKQA